MVSVYSSCKIWPPVRYALADNWFVQTLIHLGETFVKVSIRYCITSSTLFSQLLTALSTAKLYSAYV
jgi:hypothetical protein